MHYEINVCKHNRHFFATAERSITTRQQAHKMWELFVQKFPPSEDYSITVSLRTVEGMPVNFTKEPA